MAGQTASRTRVRKAVRYRLAKLRWKWWSVQNWRKGYKFGPIQRFRCCDHTTPVHYQACPHRPALTGPSVDVDS